jgi:hypothetical protein
MILTSLLAAYRVLRRKFEPNMGEMTGGQRKLRNEEQCFVFFAKYN